VDEAFSRNHLAFHGVVISVVGPILLLRRSLPLTASLLLDVKASHGNHMYQEGSAPCVVDTWFTYAPPLRFPVFVLLCVLLQAYGVACL